MPLQVLRRRLLQHWRQTLQLSAPALQRQPQRALQAVLQAQQALPAFVQTRGRTPQPLGDAIEPLGARVEVLQHQIAQARTQPLQSGQLLVARRRAQLGRRGGRGRAQVRGEIDQGEVGFVTHAGDHRHGHGHHGTDHALVVEAPQILDRAAATHQQQHIALTRGVAARRLPQGSDDLVGRGGALHRRRIDGHRHMGRAPAQRRDDVAQRCGPERGDDTDAAWKTRRHPLAPGIEQALGLQLGLQAQELLVQTAQAGRLQALDDQLQVAAGAVQVQPPLCLDHHAFARLELQAVGRAPEHGATDLARTVLEREIAMPAGRAGKARNLAAHRDRIEPGRQSVSNGAQQRANCPHSP